MLSSITKSTKENFILLCAVCITFVVYSQFLSFSHISWDDPEMVFKNKAVKDFNIVQFFTDHYVGNYIPVTMFFHAIAWSLFENNDWGHHLLNILFHLINGILVYQLGKRLFQNNLVANLGAIIFLLHPLQIESVGWIAELKNLTSTLFFLLSALYYLDYKEESQKNKYVFALLFFVLACLSKSSAIILPLCLVGIDFLYNKNISIKTIIEKSPFFVLAIIFGLINIKTQTADQFINHAHEFPFYQRIALAGYALFNYFSLFVLPMRQSVIYPFPELILATFVKGFFMLCAVIAIFVLLFKRRNRNLIFILGFILINFILVLQFVPFGEVLYADRYMYVPTIGFAWLIGVFISKYKIPHSFVLLGLSILLVIFSFSRMKVWTSALSLYEDIIKKYPNEFVALNSAGVECMFLNQDAKALDYLNRAVKVAPNNYKGFYNRGLLHLKNKKPELALKSFNETLKLYDYHKAYAGRASAYYMLSDFPKAIQDANYVLGNDKQITTSSASRAHFVLGNCYNDMNKLDEAMQEYNKCIEINTEEPDFYFKRAIVFGKKQDFNSCLGDLDICLSLNSKYYEAYYWRGVAKVNLKLNPCEDFKVAALQNYEPAINGYNKYCR